LKVTAENLFTIFLSRKQFGVVFVNLKYISLTVALCVLSLTACTQKTGTADKPLISQSRLDDIVAEHPMFSGSVVIAQDGKIIADVHIGQADQELAILNDAKTLHSIASVGKMFTSVAIAQLVEAGKIAYDTPVLDVVPELGDQIDIAITVDHLLHHTSGLGRISDVDDETWNAISNNADYFALILVSGISSSGPSAFSYRNENYQILGEIIARVSGQSYESHVREYVGTAAGMDGPLFVRQDRSELRSIAQPYLAVDFETWWNSEDSIVAHSVDEFVHAAPVATPAAAGGSYLTAADMIRFATALREGTLISPDSFKAMCSLTPGDAEVGRGYGRGCTVSVADSGTRAGHTGSTAGLQARFFMYLEKGIDVIVLSNHDEQAEPLFAEIDAMVRAQ
jgi:D-alanyl-D-alanine carboxypeptidase